MDCLFFQAYVKDHLTQGLICQVYTFVQNVLPSDSQSNQTAAAARSTEISEEGFLVALAHILKGSPEQKAAVICCLASGMAQGPVTVAQMITVNIRTDCSYCQGTYNLFS